jgi:thiol-disulfide isomerase/thioredoxin
VEAVSKAPLQNFTVNLRLFKDGDISLSQKTVSDSNGCYSVTVDPSAAACAVEIQAPAFQPNAAGRKSPADGDMRIDFEMEKASTNIAGGGAGSAPAGLDEAPPKKLLNPGDPAPLFEVKTVQGQPLRLADFRGKFVLLDFWATWCRPCVHETPFLKAAFAAFGDDPRFAMIGLSLDDAAFAPVEYARKNEIKWTQGFLGQWSQSTVTPLYGVDGIPSIFLLGPDGKIIARDLRGEEIRAAVARALGSR